MSIGVRLAVASIGLLGLVASASAQWWVRVPYERPEQLQQAALRFQHIAVQPGVKAFEVDVDETDWAWLTQNGFRVELDSVRSAQLQAWSTLEVNSIPGFACYRTVEETLATVDQLVAQYPSLASRINIGSSWERVQNPNNGYPLAVLKLTNSNHPAPAGGKPKMFVITGLHAREYTPPELITRFAESMLSQYGSNANITWMLDRFEFHFLLQANPDGRKKTEALQSNGTHWLWRKNTNTSNSVCSGSPTSSYHPGIDLNRNFQFKWNSTGGAGSSGAACDATYRGPSAGSEPETMAIIGYLSALFPDQRGPSDLDAAPLDVKGMFMDIHSYSQLVVWPWGDTTNPSPNANEFNLLGRRLAYFNGYTPAQSSDPSFLYTTDGVSDDQGYGVLGVPSFTFELGTAFFQSCTEFEQSVLPGNFTALNYAARLLHAPFQLSRGPDIALMQISATSVVQGASVTITAMVDDNRYSHANDADYLPQAHWIHSASLYLNAMPWDGAAPIASFMPLDGTLNSSSETMRATISTAGWPVGKHLLVVQGSNQGTAAGQPGPPSAVFLTVTAPALPDPLFGDQFEDTVP